MMNIGFDAKRAFFNRTGLGNFGRWHISLMEQCLENANITLFTPNAECENLFSNNPNRKVISTGSGIKGNVCRVFPGSLIKNAGIDLYHGLSNELPLGNSWNKGVRTVLTVHDLIFEHYPELYDPTSRSIYRYKLKYSCKKADLIHCVSLSTSRDLQRLYNIHAEKIRVIPLGTGLLNYNHGFKGSLLTESFKTSYFLCVSGLEKRKNLERLIEAFSHSAVSDKHLLVIAGKKGDASVRIHKMRNRSKHKDRIIILENVSSRQLSDLYQKASAFVYPSIYEGFGIPVLEALSYNLPVFTSENSSMPEVAGKAGVYFDPLNVESMTNALNQFENVVLMNQVLKCIPEQLALFNDKTIGESWKSIYSELTSLKNDYLERF